MMALDDELKLALGSLLFENIVLRKQLEAATSQKTSEGDGDDEATEKPADRP